MYLRIVISKITNDTDCVGLKNDDNMHIYYYSFEVESFR